MITLRSGGTVLTPSAAMKVGELAKRTGISVRTLHYYDEIGLLSPSELTPAGHRLYGVRELMRLQQIKSLRQLGFSLDEVRGCLDSPEFSPRHVIQLHVHRLRDQIEHQQRLASLLETIAETFSTADSVSVDRLIDAIEGITIMETRFTADELREIRERGEKLGADHIRSVEAEWPELIAGVRAEMEKGTDPASEPVKALARRWKELVKEFTGGNPSIEQKLSEGYQSSPAMQERSGLDPQIFQYIGKAMASLE